MENRDPQLPIQINNSQVIIVVVPDSPAELFNGTFTGIPMMNTPNGLVPYQNAAPLELTAGETIEAEVVAKEEPQSEPPRIIRDPLRKPTYSYIDSPMRKVEKERLRWDSSDYLAAGLVSGLVVSVTGIVGILAYAAYSIYLAVGAALSSLASLGGIGAILFIGAMAYWATSLLGFWDHTKPSTSSGPAPAVVPAVRSIKSPRVKVSRTPELMGVPLVKAIEAKKAVRPKSKKPPAPIDENLTQRWIDRLRNSSQAYGNEEITALGTSCGVGHLLAITGDDGKKMVKRYGLPVLRKVAKMNDSYKTLPQIAKYLERNVK